MYTPIPELIMLEAIDDNYPNSMSEEMTGMYWDEEDELLAAIFEDKDSHFPYM